MSDLLRTAFGFEFCDNPVQFETCYSFRKYFSDFELLNAYSVVWPAILAFEVCMLLLLRWRSLCFGLWVSLESGGGRWFCVETRGSTRAGRNCILLSNGLLCFRGWGTRQMEFELFFSGQSTLRTEGDSWECCCVGSFRFGMNSNEAVPYLYDSSGTTRKVAANP
jgi:hypothetical protein